MFGWLKKFFGAEEKPLAKEVQIEGRRVSGANEVRIQRIPARLMRKRVRVPMAAQSGRVQTGPASSFVAGAVAGVVGAAVYDHLTEDNSSDYECDYDSGDCDGGDW